MAAREKKPAEETGKAPEKPPAAANTSVVAGETDNPPPAATEDSGKGVKAENLVSEIEYEPCPVCHGTRIEEFNHGFLSRPCQNCQGAGVVVKGAAVELGE